MKTRDDNILEHIGRYHLSTRAVIEHLYFEDKTCDHVIQRLLEERRIQSFPGLPGGLSYYQLTLSEARRRGVPQHRTQPHHASSLREALAVLWFCCMSGKKRKRIERRQLTKLFGRGKGFGHPHCAEETETESVIYRIYAPGPNSRNDYRIRTLHEECKIALAHPRLAEWVMAEAFRFALIVETPGRHQTMKELVELKGPWPVRIHLELVPDVGELAAQIRAFRQSQTTRASSAPEDLVETQTRVGLTL